jgi:hypothetical protein
MRVGRKRMVNGGEYLTPQETSVSFRRMMNEMQEAVMNIRMSWSGWLRSLTNNELDYFEQYAKDNGNKKLLQDIREERWARHL